MAGAAAIDITPTDTQFLWGYPHVERYSTGVHDPLFSTALFLSDGSEEVLFAAQDIIFIGRDTAARVRRRITEKTGVPEGNIMVTATHTHSGPMTVDYLSNEADAVIPITDHAYLAFMEDRIVEAAIQARNNAESAEIGLAQAKAEGVGTNRRDPSGPADPCVPVLVVRSKDQTKYLACMLVYSMHPTVLHEDSTLVSADFPGMTRYYLREHILGTSCPVLYQTGPSGNQSPRQVTKGNTFAEAERLGYLLGEAVERIITDIEYTADVRLRARRTFIDPPRRDFPPIHETEKRLAMVRRRFERLKNDQAPPEIVRTAECDLFGAEETLTLARAAAEGRIDATYESILPAEIQLISIGPWTYIGWPGECFVEYSLTVKAERPDTFVISLANGELQGYIVTEEAETEGGYEASNSLFKPHTGQLLIEATRKLLLEC